MEPDIREPLFAKTTRAVSGAEGEATPGARFDRLIMVILGRLFLWRDALVNVQPDTFLRYRRKGYRLFGAGNPGL
jgi:hypothetical protein